MNEFFFRVASLAFETNVLAELEKSGSRQIGEVVSEYLHDLSVTMTTSTSFLWLNARLCVCFRNQQHVKQSERHIEEERAQLLSVRRGAGVSKTVAALQLMGGASVVEGGGGGTLEFHFLTWWSSVFIGLPRLFLGRMWIFEELQSDT